MNKAIEVQGDLQNAPYDVAGYIFRPWTMYVSKLQNSYHVVLRKREAPLVCNPGRYEALPDMQQPGGHASYLSFGAFDLKELYLF